MNKRTFFQGLVSVLALFGVGRGIASTGSVSFEPGTAYPDFDPTKTHCNWVVLSDDWETIGEDAQQKVKNILIAEARRSLPPGTVFEVHVCAARRIVGWKWEPPLRPGCISVRKLRNGDRVWSEYVAA